MGFWKLDGNAVEVVFAHLYAKYQCGLISLAKASLELGMAVQTGYNRAAAGSYPVVIVYDGGKPRVRLMDLAHYFAGEGGRKRRKRGRPRKAL